MKKNIYPFQVPLFQFQGEIAHSGLETGSNEGSLLMSRFCVDFRYLNSNTQAFLSTIPNVDELTGSFTRHIPNFISSIDFRSGFFQMRISSESTKYQYTAFNTCFGTFKVNGLHMGLKASPNSFPLLKNKVFNGLSFRNTLCYLDDVGRRGSEHF